MGQNVAILTGITGQDGSLLARYLIDKGDYTVVGMVRRNSTPNLWRLKELEILSDKNFILVSGDLTDQGSIDRILIEHQPNEIYNLGAQSFVGTSWDSPISTLDITGLGAIRIFESARNYCKDARIYQASSSEIYGGAFNTDILDEDSLVEPRSPYGIAKATAHYAAKNYREAYDMFISCGILFNHESEYRGREFVTRKVTWESAKIYLGIIDKIYLGNVNAMRDWGYALDYVEGMWQMLQHNEPDDFVLATGKAKSVLDLCKQALNTYTEKSFDWQKHIVSDVEAYSRPTDVGHLCGDSSKAREILGWKPKTSFEKMIDIMTCKDIERVKKEYGIFQ